MNRAYAAVRPPSTIGRTPVAKVGTSGPRPGRLRTQQGQDVALVGSARRAREAVQAGTLAGGRALGFGENLGALRVGASADIVGYRTDTVTFTPLNDPVRQLVYAERGTGLTLIFARPSHLRTR